MVFHVRVSTAGALLLYLDAYSGAIPRTVVSEANAAWFRRFCLSSDDDVVLARRFAQKRSTYPWGQLEQRFHRATSTESLRQQLSTRSMASSRDAITNISHHFWMPFQRQLRTSLRASRQFAATLRTMTRTAAFRSAVDRIARTVESRERCMSIHISIVPSASSSEVTGSSVGGRAPLIILQPSISILSGGSIQPFVRVLLHELAHVFLGSPSSDGRLAIERAFTTHAVNPAEARIIEEALVGLAVSDSGSLSWIPSTPGRRRNGLRTHLDPAGAYLEALQTLRRTDPSLGARPFQEGFIREAIRILRTQHFQGLRSGGGG